MPFRARGVAGIRLSPCLRPSQVRIWDSLHCACHIDPYHVGPPKIHQPPASDPCKRHSSHPPNLSHTHTLSLAPPSSSSHPSNHVHTCRPRTPMPPSRTQRRSCKRESTGAVSFNTEPETLGRLGQHPIMHRDRQPELPQQQASNVTVRRPPRA